VGSLVFFAADDGAGDALWKSNGQSAGTAMVSAVAPYEGDYGGDMLGIGNTLFFVADDGTHGVELWRSNGTDAGTVMVRDIRQVADDEYAYAPSDFAAVGQHLYFVADDGLHGEEPWRSDGTEQGTDEVRDINVGGGLTLSRRAVPDPRRGTAVVTTFVEGAGHLVVEPAGKKLIKTVREHPRRASRVRVTLTPNAAGMRKLRHALRVAHREGKDVGRIRVGARFTFTPCGGGPSSQTRRYTLSLR
jgi:ELWxxDGT repeat protein